jgi:hypothetical protein
MSGRFNWLIIAAGQPPFRMISMREAWHGFGIKDSTNDRETGPFSL